MSTQAKLFLVEVAVIAILVGGFFLLRAYLSALLAGKSVREGRAAVVEVRGLGCEEAKGDVLQERYRWHCWPGERILRVYLRIEHFRTLSPKTMQDCLQLSARTNQRESGGATTGPTSSRMCRKCEWATSKRSSSNFSQSFFQTADRRSSTWPRAGDKATAVDVCNQSLHCSI